MPFKQTIIKVLANSMICFTLYLYNNFQVTEKDIRSTPLHK